MENNHESYNLEELLAGYVLGNLEEQELTWLNQELAANPQLQQQIRELETTLTLMPYSLSQNVPSPDLRNKICQKFANSQINNIQTKYSKPIKFNRFAWILTGITAFTTLFFGINNYSLRQQLVNNNNQLQQHQELISLLRQPDNRLVALQGLDQLPNASGSLFIAPEEKKAILALQNLAPLSGNEVYRLWAVSLGKKTGCANFTPNKQGMVHLEFSNNALQDADSVVITVEPTADTLQPLGSPMINGYFQL